MVREIDRIAGLIGQWFAQQSDLALESFTFMVGTDMLMMLGPHSRVHGFCWCQAKMVPHGQHAHPVHQEAVN